MRVPREMKTLFASLFGPSPLAAQRASKEPLRKMTTWEAGHKIGGDESLSPGSIGNGFDRVTLSGQVTALNSGIDARADLPSPPLPAIGRNGTAACCRTPATIDVDRPVVSLLPASSVHHQPPPTRR